MFRHIVVYETTIFSLAHSWDEYSSDVALKARERSEFDVVANILRLAAIGLKKEDIMIGCNLGDKAVQQYLAALVQLKLLLVEERSGRLYRTTGRGLELLRFYHGLRWLLWRKDFDVLMLRIMTRLKGNKHPYYVS